MSGESDQLDESEFLRDFNLTPGMQRAVIETRERFVAECTYVEDPDDFQPAPATFRENCTKCKNGRFVSYAGRVVGNCFACKGVGYFIRKTSTESRAAKKAQREAKKTKTTTETLAYFAGQYPEIAMWIEGERRNFAFAQDMHDAIIKFGYLTERQLTGCQRCIDARKNQAIAAATRVASAPVVDTSKLNAAFDAAKRKGLKNPKLRFEGFTASLAKASSVNAGAIYIVAPRVIGDEADGVYFGKIKDHKFLASRDCPIDIGNKVVAAMADPLALAIAYGKRTGNCSCCNRQLTDPVSVVNGIGPICAAGFGF